MIELGVMQLSAYGKVEFSENCCSKVISDIIRMIRQRHYVTSKSTSSVSEIAHFILHWTEVFYDKSPLDKIIPPARDHPIPRIASQYITSSSLH